MSASPARSLERSGFAALVALLLAPVVAQGVWRPLVHVFGAAGSAASVTGAALVVAASLALACHLPLGVASRRPWLFGGPVAVVASLGLSLGLPGLLTQLVVVATLGPSLPWLAARLPDSFDGLARRRPRTTALYVVVALAALVSTARLSVFIGDPSRVDMQMLPGDTFLETHSCLTAYVRASLLVRQGVHNVYEDPWWYGSNGLPPSPDGVESAYAPFALDNFSYPPPFLLLASPLAALDGDFAAQRALWFGLNGVLLALGLWTVARFVDGPRAHRVLLLAPLFFGSMPVLVTLQIGNFHLAALVLSVLAMVAFAERRDAAGGALLALSVLSKISPGVLGVVLLLRRRFRAALLTAGFGVALLALCALCFGRDPIVSFLGYALPRLASGAAFPFMDTESGIVTNMAPFGVPFKLRLLGLDVGDPWLFGQRVTRVYTVALVLLVALAARQRKDRREQAVTWMALLALSALQSPFAPGYAPLGLLWATTLLAAEVRGARGAVALVALWLFALFVPPGLSAELRAIQSMAQTALVLAVGAWLVVRAPREPEAAPVSVVGSHGRSE